MRRYNKLHLLCLILATLVLTAAGPLYGEVKMLPSTLSYKASHASSPPVKVLFKGVNNNDEVLYRMQPLKGPSGVLGPERFRINTPYTKGFQPLDRFQYVLTGKADEQVEALFSTEITWRDVPGIYKGKLVSNSDERELPIEVTVLRTTALSLNPTTFDLIPSPDMKTPIVTRVEIYLASNSRRWQLYAVTQPLVKEGGEKEIKTERIFVRLARDDNSGKWTSLDEPFRVAEGGPGPNRKVATLELAVESRRTDLPGQYEGTFKLMIANTP